MRVDLDEGSFINSFSLSDDEDYETDGPNIGCDIEMAKVHFGGCKQNYFALRDIEEGEELLLDYGQFAIQDRHGDRVHQPEGAQREDEGEVLPRLGELEDQERGAIDRKD